MDRFDKFGNIMIDIETLSTHKNASIIEIGAVEFNKFTGEIGEIFNVFIIPKEWSENKRHIDGETIKWWMIQNEDARKRFNRNNDDCVTLYDALLLLRHFALRCGKDVAVWGNGSSFDIAILEDAFNYFDIEIPWNFRKVFDVRTIAELKPEIKDKHIFKGIKHSSVDDCINEIEYLTQIIKNLKL